jgi:hypothetical protein
MAWRVVKQPSGRYAIFSEVVDNFTLIDATRDEMVRECCQKGMGVIEAIEKVDRAFKDQAVRRNGSRWSEAIDIIRDVHGEAALREALGQFDDPIDREPPCTS